MSGAMARNKGGRGEREVVQLLNSIINQVILSQEWPHGHVEAARMCIQRNQNQSAIGGCDLNGVFGIAIEVKRQEQLNLNSWWTQCVEQAKRNNELPVLIYRQNHQPWRVVTMMQAPLPGARSSTYFRAEIEEEPFRIWFYQWVYYKMVAGELPRI